jgi:hypothetical protein
MTDAVEKSKMNRKKNFCLHARRNQFFVIQCITESLRRPLAGNRTDYMSPTSFSDHRTGASEKIRSTPRKTFFNSIGPLRYFATVN